MEMKIINDTGIEFENSSGFTLGAVRICGSRVSPLHIYMGAGRRLHDW